LTAQEKEAKLKELEELRIKKRQERQDIMDREKRRMTDGKAVSKLRQELNDQELVKMAEERRREKQETADAKKRALENIEADKRARQMEREAKKNKGAPPPSKPAVAVSPAPAVPQRNYDEAKLQIRLSDGTTLVQTFKAKEPLSAVRVYVQMNRSDGDKSAIVKFMTSFPRKIFSEEDYEKPLETLGLCPSAVVIVSK
jgi:hypothetical protein